MKTRRRFVGSKENEPGRKKSDALFRLFTPGPLGVSAEDLQEHAAPEDSQARQQSQVFPARATDGEAPVGSIPFNEDSCHVRVPFRDLDAAPRKVNSAMIRAGNSFSTLSTLALVIFAKQPSERRVSQ
jgi:hypothetical protein